jgi:hypothetical protein
MPVLRSLPGPGAKSITTTAISNVISLLLEELIFKYCYVLSCCTSVLHLKSPPSSEEQCGALPLSPLYTFVLWCLDTRTWYGRGSILGRGQEIFLLSVQTDYGAHPTSYPMGTGGSFFGSKRARGKADHSPPSCAEVKK